ncbi:HSP20-like chaperone [Aspergillus avenaceus]|uniref:HSP20-like chaperone n=1 Tax=Aspergillus avenaceus TaxID=36643 RepID=A0A5N6U9X4_ASPAV|nr:HSP20-like chaperone [Aspergillus avenaceus]
MQRLLDEYDRYLSGRSPVPHRAYAPTFDMRETQDAYELEGELPGVKEEDVAIEFADSQTMRIQGHAERAEERKGSWWMAERATGEFQRSFRFPGTVDQDMTTARLKDGVLSVTVPKIRS